jgi:hypothetical protein
VGYGDWDVPRPGWTCAECGFVFDEFDPHSVSETIAKIGKRLRAPLTRGLKDEDLDTVLRTRPEPDMWSALEYACHVRDALRINIERVPVTAAGNPPEFQALARDEAVVERKYNEQDPSVVADEIEADAATLAAAFAAVPDDAWQNYWMRGDMKFTIDWMARNVQHEVDHHLLDIGRTLRHVRGR